MKLIHSFQNRVDRFLYRHPNFGLPRLMMVVILGNIAVFLLTMMDRSGTFLSYLTFQPALVLRGQIWRLITFVFVPSSYNLVSQALFLYFYYFIGNALEREWGSGKFTVYYLLGMILTILYGLIAYFISGRNVHLTSNYVNLSMFFVFATLWPENRVLLFFFIPIKIKWLAYFEAAVFLLSMFSGWTLLPLVAVLNYFLFCGDVLMAALSMRFGRRSPGTVNFRKAAKQQQKQAQTRNYGRKCAVCGRTDTEYPQLEFRYCSRCTGYHCFCIDHINSHIHFTE